MPLRHKQIMKEVGLKVLEIYSKLILELDTNRLKSFYPEMSAQIDTLHAKTKMTTRFVTPSGARHFEAGVWLLAISWSGANLDEDLVSKARKIVGKIQNSVTK